MKAFEVDLSMTYNLRYAWVKIMALFSQFRFPRRVLISPLCANIRNGCASAHVGNVVVLKRWW